MSSKSTSEKLRNQRNEARAECSRLNSEILNSSKPEPVVFRSGDVVMLRHEGLMTPGEGEGLTDLWDKIWEQTGVRFVTIAGTLRFARVDDESEPCERDVYQRMEDAEARRDRDELRKARWA